MITQEKDIADPQLRQQQDAGSKKYDEAVNNNDAAAVAALYTEDAVFVTDRGPVYGRQAIEKWYADVFREWHPKNHTSKSDQYSPHPIGTAMWSDGDWSETGQGQTGEPIQIKGYWSEIKVREGDAWKIRMLTWNITPAEAK
jgi:uncharacterized protein (TIGR02246 family)